MQKIQQALIIKVASLFYLYLTINAQLAAVGRRAINLLRFITSMRDRGRVHLLMRPFVWIIFCLSTPRLTRTSLSGHPRVARQVSHVMMSWRVPFRSMGSPRRSVRDLTIYYQPMFKEGATRATRPVSYARIMRQISHAFPRDNACSIPPPSLIC